MPYIFQNEALHSKYHKHISKANICLCHNIIFFCKYHIHSVVQNLKRFFHKLFFVVVNTVLQSPKKL